MAAIAFHPHFLEHGISVSSAQDLPQTRLLIGGKSIASIGFLMAHSDANRASVVNHRKSIGFCKLAS
ncbi:hypothetical protein OS189_13740 [Sulfitobacter sp. F26169L]|nr:hypothetical protein [Sulfitobacter sp. F26169L]